jgi:hypothetical protein
MWDEDGQEELLWADEDREATLRLYARRAEAGLPLFEPAAEPSRPREGGRARRSAK